jgi:hypothetical protein
MFIAQSLNIFATYQLPHDNYYSYLYHQAGWQSSKSLDFDLRGTWFESWLNYQLPRLIFFYGLLHYIEANSRNLC